jgi:hypothetical protein
MAQIRRSLTRCGSGQVDKAVNLDRSLEYYGLVSWWLDSFSSAERKLIEERYQPFSVAVQLTGDKEDGSRPEPHEDSSSPDEESVPWSSQSALAFLSGLSSWFNRPGTRHLARRMLEKASDLEGDVLDRHFLYQHEIEVAYRERDERPGALAEAIEACRAQITMAATAAAAFRAEYPGQPLPGHVGYQQLAVIYEKQGNLNNAMALAKQARGQQWTGDWDRRIERLMKKDAKARAAAEHGR